MGKARSRAPRMCSSRLGGRDPDNTGRENRLNSLRGNITTLTSNGLERFDQSFHLGLAKQCGVIDAPLSWLIVFSEISETAVNREALAAH